MPKVLEKTKETIEEYNLCVMNVEMSDRNDCTLVVAEVLVPLMDKTVENFKQEIEAALLLGKPTRGKTDINYYATNHVHMCLIISL